MIELNAIIFQNVLSLRFTITISMDKIEQLGCNETRFIIPSGIDIWASLQWSHTTHVKINCTECGKSWSWNGKMLETPIFVKYKLVFVFLNYLRCAVSNLVIHSLHISFQPHQTWQTPVLLTVKNLWEIQFAKKKSCYNSWTREK